LVLPCTHRLVETLVVSVHCMLGSPYPCAWSCCAALLCDGRGGWGWVSLGVCACGGVRLGCPSASASPWPMWWGVLCVVAGTALCAVRQGGCGIHGWAAWTSESEILLPARLVPDVQCASCALSVRAVRAVTVVTWPALRCEIRQVVGAAVLDCDQVTDRDEPWFTTACGWVQWSTAAPTLFSVPLDDRLAAFVRATAATAHQAAIHAPFVMNPCLPQQSGQYTDAVIVSGSICTSV